jgi:hypothetical protein
VDEVSTGETGGSGHERADQPRLLVNRAGEKMTDRPRRKPSSPTSGIAQG